MEFTVSISSYSDWMVQPLSEVTPSVSLPLSPNLQEPTIGKSNSSGCKHRGARGYSVNVLGSVYELQREGEEAELIFCVRIGVDQSAGAGQGNE
jgi:hypothetical protein